MKSIYQLLVSIDPSDKGPWLVLVTVWGLLVPIVEALAAHLTGCSSCRVNAFHWTQRYQKSWQFTGPGRPFQGIVLYLSVYAKVLADHAPLVPIPDKDFITLICHHFSFGPHDDACDVPMCPYSLGGNVRTCCIEAGGQHHACRMSAQPLGDLLQEVGDPDSASSALRHHIHTAHQLQLMRDFFLGDGETSRFPIKRLPAELRNDIYRHMLTYGRFNLPDYNHMSRSNDAIAVSRSGFLWNEAYSIFTEEAILVVDLSCNKICEERDSVTDKRVTYDASAAHMVGPLGKYVRNIEWLTMFKNLVFTTPQHFTCFNIDISADRHWETVALNLKALFSVQGQYQYRWKWEEWKTLSFRIGLGNTTGLVPHFKTQLQLGLDMPRALTGFEKLMCTHRRHYGQMTPTGQRNFERRPPPLDLTGCWRRWDLGFCRHSKDEMRFKLYVLTWLGNLAKRLNLRVMLKKDPDDKDGVEWITKAPGCERGCARCYGRQPDRRCGGADVRDLYLLADEIKDQGVGLWLCSEQ